MSATALRVPAILLLSTCVLGQTEIGEDTVPEDDGHGVGYGAPLQRWHSSSNSRLILMKLPALLLPLL